jgi:hypothetical protein
MVSRRSCPVDEYILRAANKVGIERPCDTWSRWNDQHKYEAFQKRLRDEAFKCGKIPLALEHYWWMEEAGALRQGPS